MKSVVIPETNQSYYEKLQKTEIGKQKYWWNYFYSDYESGTGLLTLIMSNEDSSHDIASNKYAMRAIMSNYVKETVQEAVKTSVSNLELIHNN